MCQGCLPARLLGSSLVSKWRSVNVVVTCFSSVLCLFLLLVIYIRALLLYISVYMHSYLCTPQKGYRNINEHGNETSTPTICFNKESVCLSVLNCLVEKKKKQEGRNLLYTQYSIPKKKKGMTADWDDDVEKFFCCV